MFGCMFISCGARRAGCPASTRRALGVCTVSSHAYAAAESVSRSQWEASPTTFTCSWASIPRSLFQISFGRSRSARRTSSPTRSASPTSRGRRATARSRSESQSARRCAATSNDNTSITPARPMSPSGRHPIPLQPAKRVTSDVQPGVSRNRRAHGPRRTPVCNRAHGPHRLQSCSRPSPSAIVLMGLGEPPLQARASASANPRLQAPHARLRDHFAQWMFLGEHAGP